MAKIGMICPFSGQLCKECPLYRGRHYFLCFCERYRGHLDGPEDMTEMATSPASGLSPTRRFEIPALKLESALDPFDIIMREGEEG